MTDLYDIDLYCPKNYPNILFSVDNDLVLAKSFIEAKKRFGKKVTVAKITEIVSSNGHSRANSILKSIGDTWVCKNGYIFFG